MAANQYHFVTHWRVTGSADEVFALVNNEGLGYGGWWSAVYVKVEEVTKGDEAGVGQMVRFHSRGALPYSINWTSRRVELDRPRRVVFRAEGDFDGWAIWTVEQQGAEVVATLDWKLNAEKPLLRLLSPILKPLFEWNHHWAMRQGYEAIQRELGARRAQSA